MRNLTHIYILLTVFFTISIAAENVKAQGGLQFQENLIRIVQPGQLGDTLSVWGDVREPGRYLVPRGVKVSQVVEFAGGPAGSRISGNQNAWSRTRISISVSKFDEKTGETDYHQFHMKYNDELPPEMRYFQLSSNDIVSVEVRQKPGFLDVLGVIGPILGTLTTSYLFYDRVLR